MLKQPYKMEFDIGTIKHLGLQMYSTLPPVIGELVSNAWDANARKVKITIPETSLNYDTSEIIVDDDGLGMSDDDIRKAYLIVGRDRRADEGVDITPPPFNRKIMGRKGIGKFSAFGVAGEIEVESIKDGQTSRFILNYEELEKSATKREILLPPLEPTNTVKKGTKITLRKITKFQNRSIQLQSIRRGLARRFSIIGVANKFEIEINKNPIKPEERDLKALLQKDSAGNLYIWEYDNVEVKEGTGWTVSGWIGAHDRTRTLDEGIGFGITIMARGKLVQEPFVFETTVGQQFALSYLVGELHAEFVDAEDDTIGTTRNSLVWETDANKALLEWGQKEVNGIARKWSTKRSQDNEAELDKNPLYQNFKNQLSEIDNRRAAKVVDKLVRDTIRKDLTSSPEQLQTTVQMCIDYLEFDTFIDIAQDLNDTDSSDIPKLLDLFREWEIIEAKEMMKVTRGRIETIEKLQNLIDTNALEVPTLHNFLKTFPWVLDPRWTLIADEKTYSDLLRKNYPEDADIPENERRIDFLCVREGYTLVVVEIKRPKVKISRKQLDQIEDYVIFMRDFITKTTDPDMRFTDVVGYLLCGDLVNKPEVRGKREILANSRIFVKLYKDLLRMVENSHQEFLERYEELRKKRKSDG
jgi:hypothetical protein